MSRSGWGRCMHRPAGRHMCRPADGCMHPSEPRRRCVVGTGVRRARAPDALGMTALGYRPTVAALEEALARAQFAPVDQPLFDRRTEGMTGVEALLRWRHPRWGRSARSLPPRRRAVRPDRADRPLGAAHRVRTVGALARAAPAGDVGQRLRAPARGRRPRRGPRGRARPRRARARGPDPRDRRGRAPWAARGPRRRPVPALGARDASDRRDQDRPPLRVGGADAGRGTRARPDARQDRQAARPGDLRRGHRGRRPPARAAGLGCDLGQGFPLALPLEPQRIDALLAGARPARRLAAV